MTDRKPRVLATRHFPPDVEARLAGNFDALLIVSGVASPAV